MKDFLYTIKDSATIADALLVITENRHGAVIVVDSEYRLAGVVSDGDLRRAMVKGATSLTPLYKILNPNVISITEKGSQEESSRIFKKHIEINLVPIIDGNNCVRYVIPRTPATH